MQHQDLTSKETKKLSLKQFRGASSKTERRFLTESEIEERIKIQEQMMEEIREEDARREAMKKKQGREKISEMER